MIKKITILLFLLGLSHTSFAQRMDPENNPRIKRLKIAFITERLDLSTKEAQAFWPIYNAHEEKIFQLRNVELRKLRRNLEDNFTEQQAEKSLERMLEIESEIHQANVDLVANLKNAIPAKKIVLLKKTEKDFGREMLKRFRNKRKPPGNRP